MPESGDWIGFYTYGDNQVHHTMEISLSFAGGVIAGRGMDDIGRFSISGAVGGADCRWAKAYETHSVKYLGSLDEGKIWGTWSAGSNKGGFMIWPRRSDGEMEAIEAEQVEEGVLVTGGAVHAKPR